MHTLAPSILAQFDIDDTFYAPINETFNAQRGTPEPVTGMDLTEAYIMMLVQAIQFLKTIVWVLIFLIVLLSLTVLRLAPLAQTLL